MMKSNKIDFFKRCHKIRFVKNEEKYFLKIGKFKVTNNLEELLTHNFPSNYN